MLKPPLLLLHTKGAESVDSAPLLIKYKLLKSYSSLCLSYDVLNGETVHLEQGRNFA